MHRIRFVVTVAHSRGCPTDIGFETEAIAQKWLKIARHRAVVRRIPDGDTTTARSCYDVWTVAKFAASYHTV